MTNEYRQSFLDYLFQSWFGGTKMKSVIGFDKVVAILHKTGAPSDVRYQTFFSDQFIFLQRSEDMEINTEIWS